MASLNVLQPQMATLKNSSTPDGYFEKFFNFESSEVEQMRKLRFLYTSEYNLYLRLLEKISFW